MDHQTYTEDEEEDWILINDIFDEQYHCDKAWALDCCEPKGADAFSTSGDGGCGRGGWLFSSRRNQRVAFFKGRCEDQQRQQPGIQERLKPEFHQMTLTDTDVELIRASWTPARTDPVGAGVLLFKGLFTKFPDYLKFFNQFSDLDLDNMHENKRLVKHAVKVIDTITFVVGSIGEQAKTEQLNDALLNLVRSHLKRRIGLKEFRNLGIVLIDFICELNNRRINDGTTKLPTSDLRNSSRLTGRNNDTGGARGGNSSASSSQDSETMTSALDKIRASTSSSSSSDDDNLVARTDSSVLIKNNDEIVASQIDNRENHNRFSNDTPPKPETKIDDNDSELAARRSQNIKLDANLVVSAWTKLYGTILDLVKSEESHAHDNK